MRKSKEPKTTSLGWVRVSPKLIEAFDNYCKQNNLKNKSAVVRSAITQFINTEKRE